MDKAVRPTSDERSDGGRNQGPASRPCVPVTRAQRHGPVSRSPVPCVPVNRAPRHGPVSRSPGPSVTARLCRPGSPRRGCRRRHHSATPQPLLTGDREPTKYNDVAYIIRYSIMLTNSSHCNLWLLFQPIRAYSTTLPTAPNARTTGITTWFT